MVLILSIVFGMILGVVHFWSERLYFKTESSRDRVASFVAGVSVTYVFLLLLPDIYEGVGHLNRWVFILVLAGFGLVHLAEKYLYQHTHGEERLFRSKEVHFFVLFSYYFLIGVILFVILGQSILKGTMFFVPLLFYAIVGRVSFAKVHSHIREQIFFRWLLAFSSVLGVLAAPLIIGGSTFYHALLAFITGSFLYLAIVDFIPTGERGRPVYFLIGAGLYTILIALIWII
ncbi:MAG: hypothetical protein BMS9Abin13_501 [Patescibacteria group bacterium]|nr:MAG: hypothetical protein BMS9Abin13_501 [Patescibacteria group bacterium]